MPREIETTVTHLEMHTRPIVRSSTPHGKLALIRAEAPPAHFFRYLYDTIGHKHFWVSRHVMEDAVLLDIIHDEKVHILVLHVNGVPAGFAELDLRTPSIADLAFFGLIPEFQGRGLGRFLLSSTIETAWMHHPTKLTVQTSTLDHPRALRLYQRSGFTPTRQSHVTLTVPDNF
ncbi:MAG: GNAT family N-acetyltransferase [Parvibaculum sp.]